MQYIALCVFLERRAIRTSLGFEYIALISDLDDVQLRVYFEARVSGTAYGSWVIIRYRLERHLRGAGVSRLALKMTQRFANCYADFPCSLNALREL